MSLPNKELTKIVKDLQERVEKLEKALVAKPTVRVVPAVEPKKT